MNTRSKEDDSLPYRISIDQKTGQKKYIEKRSKPHLTPQEAYRLNQLETVVDKYRDLVGDYIQVRASFSTTLIEKRAWWMLYGLLRFVEGYGHFPRYKEQVELFRELLTPRDPVLANLPVKEAIAVQKILIQRNVLQSNLRKFPPPRAMDLTIVREIGDQIRNNLIRAYKDLSPVPEPELTRKEGREQQQEEGVFYE